MPTKRSLPAALKLARKARGLSQDAVRRIVDDHITGRFLGLFGEPRVNVLDVNLALDGLSGKYAA